MTGVRTVRIFCPLGLKQKKASPMIIEERAKDV